MAEPELHAFSALLMDQLRQVMLACHITGYNPHQALLDYEDLIRSLPELSIMDAMKLTEERIYLYGQESTPPRAANVGGVQASTEGRPPQPHDAGGAGPVSGDQRNNGSALAARGQDPEPGSGDQEREEPMEPGAGGPHAH